MNKPLRQFVFLVVSLAVVVMVSSAFAADLAEIKKRGKLNAATSANLPPITFLDAKGELDGYDIQLAKFVEKHLGIPIVLNRLDWKGILPGLQTGRFDAVFSNVNVTNERKEIFDYSIPYSRSAVVVVVQDKIKDVKGYKDLKGRVAGGISGGMDGEIPAKEIEKEYGAYKDWKGYAGYAEMFSDLAIGRVEVLIAPDTAAANFLKERPGVGRIVGEPFKVRFVAAPMQKGSKDLKAKIDEAIRMAREQGILDKWAKQYFGIDNFSKQLVDYVP